MYIARQAVDGFGEDLFTGTEIPPRIVAYRPIILG
jgi:hypothetical protein